MSKYLLPAVPEIAIFLASVLFYPFVRLVASHFGEVGDNNNFIYTPVIAIFPLYFVAVTFAMNYIGVYSWRRAGVRLAMTLLMVCCLDEGGFHVHWPGRDPFEVRYHSDIDKVLARHGVRPFWPTNTQEVETKLASVALLFGIFGGIVMARWRRANWCFGFSIRQLLLFVAALTVFVWLAIGMWKIS